MKSGLCLEIMCTTMQPIDPVYSWRRAHLEALVDRFGAGNQTRFARRYGWDRSSIAQFLSTSYNNGKSIGDLAARDIESRVSADFKAPPRWMDSPPPGDGPLDNLRLDSRQNSVPRITWAIADFWHMRTNPIRSSSEHFDTWDLTSVAVSDNSFSLEVSGDSMVAAGPGPSFPDGAVLIVDAGRQPVVGNFVIASDPGTNRATFKKLAVDGGRYFLQPLNDNYKGLEIPDLKGIIGVVVETNMVLV